jgi:hypothetical protein
VVRGWGAPSQTSPLLPVSSRSTLHATAIIEPRIPNPKPQTLTRIPNPKPESQTPNPKAPNPKPQTLTPHPQTADLQTPTDGSCGVHKETSIMAHPPNRTSDITFADFCRRINKHNNEVVSSLPLLSPKP